MMDKIQKKIISMRLNTVDEPSISVLTRKSWYSKLCRKAALFQELISLRLKQKGSILHNLAWILQSLVSIKKKRPIHKDRSSLSQDYGKNCLFAIFLQSCFDAILIIDKIIKQHPACSSYTVLYLIQIETSKSIDHINH